jgi:hypothetical protein
LSSFGIAIVPSLVSPLGGKSGYNDKLSLFKVERLFKGCGTLETCVVSPPGGDLVQLSLEIVTLCV